MEHAKKLLEKHGWKEGMGLGKQNDGISQAVKVPLKMTTAGVDKHNFISFVTKLNF